MQVNFKFAFFVILTSQVLRLHCAVYELTVVIEAGKQECFYEVVEARGKVNVEFEVSFTILYEIRVILSLYNHVVTLKVIP